MIKSLTSLHFVFALMVFCSHLSFLKQSDSSSLRWLFDNVLFEGYIGVSFFFILSGFILAYRYTDDINQKKISVKDFLIARFARIYPLHLLTLIVSIPLVFSEYSNNIISSLIKLGSNITLTQSLIPYSAYYFTFNSPSWSISSEMGFYLLFPFVLAPLSRIKKLKTIILSMIVICLFIIFSIKIIPSNLHHSFFYISPIFRFFDFLMGIFIFKLFNISAATSKAKASYWEIISILLFATFFVFHNKIPIVYRYSIYYWIPTSILIYTFARSKGAISRLLSSKYLVLLGEASFGFYMIHQLVIRYYKVINPLVTSDIVKILIILTSSITLSIISMRYFENPINKYIKHRLSVYYDRS